jgi:hypothetical protein
MMTSLQTLFDPVAQSVVRPVCTWLVLAIAATSVLTATSYPASATPKAAAFSATLPAADRKAFESYIAAQTVYDFKLDKYWRAVEDKRAKRRRKKGKKIALTTKDYVTAYPPKYSGPKLSSRLWKSWQAYLNKDKPKTPKPKKKSIADVSDFLANAKRYYGFVPERIPEREFKRRYAEEALKLGLTADQVVRVYALETSGLGTADMQAGIHPIRRTGKPISTALGYAQLLAANSINEMVKHGKRFIARLESMAAKANSPERRQRLKSKAAALRKVYAGARAVKAEWYTQVRYSRTPRGNGIHAINIDGDIGPWLQVRKLYGLKETARIRGLTSMSGAEIELMNLAGPGTGLEMMRPAGLKVPTTNFFARGGYYRNTIVREKTSAELLKALDQRMNENMKNSGAQEFLAIFRELQAGKRAATNR